MIRTKGRNRFDYNGRDFVWHIAREVELRIASTDKQFVVMYELIGDHPRLSVSGPEFLGVPPTLNRPVWLIPPHFGQRIGGALVREILDWSFDPSHQIIPYEGPPQSTIQHAWDNLKPS